MGEEKPLKVGDIIRKFSSQSDLTTDSKPQTTQYRKNPSAHESPAQTSQVTQAQVAKIAEPSLYQNVSSEPIDINELRKKKPHIALKPFCEASPFTEKLEKTLEKSSKDQKSPDGGKIQTRSDFQQHTSGEIQEKRLTHSIEPPTLSTQPIFTKSPVNQLAPKLPPKTYQGFHCQLIKKRLTRSNNDIQKEIITMFDDLMEIIESEEYDTNLRQCLEKASPDYKTSIAKRQKDILRSDHGIVVAGETSAGKSTLINKILEMRIFKGRNMESTSTVCKIRNSDKVMIKTELENGEVERRDMSDIDVLTRKGEKTLRDTLKNLTDMTIEKDSRKYKSVDIGLPVPFLKGNTIMVDTPGIGGSGKVSQKLMEYLPNAVSFIFVINVASAGGMQRDRLPEILKAITNLQMDDEMPCFDQRSVIFITNKWDSIKKDPDDSSDEDEVEKTWKKLSERILRQWPSVRKENIFRMNLTDVYQKETATQEFNQFRKSLEKIVKENENIRTTEHFRYLHTLLDDVCTGVRTRQVLINKTKDEQEEKSKQHQMQIDLLREKCKTKSHCWRKRIQCFIEQVANDSFEYMSSDNGKERILNPKGWEPIMEVTYVPTTLSDDVQNRIDHYINEKVRSPDVIEEFKSIKDDILEFYKEISFEIGKIENEWTGTVDKSYSKREIRGSNSKGEINYKEESVAPYVAGVIATSPIWFPLLAAGVAIAVASVPFAAPVIAFLGRDSRKKKLIDKEYEKCKSIFRSKMCNSMESNHGDALNKLISKITDVILQRRIKFIEETIKELSENRERIIANQKKLINLAKKLKFMKDVAEEIKHALINCSTE